MLEDQSVDLVGPLLERRLKTWAWCECLCVLPIPSLIVDPCKIVTLTPVSPGRPMSHQTQHWPQCPVWGGGTWPVSDLDSSIQSQYPANKHWFWSDLRYSAMIDGEALAFIITVNWLELVCLLIKFGCMHQLTAVVIYLITVAVLSVETLRDSQAAPAGAHARCESAQILETGFFSLVDYKMWVMPANWWRDSPPPQLPHLLTLEMILGRGIPGPVY